MAVGMDRGEEGGDGGRDEGAIFLAPLGRGVDTIGGTSEATSGGAGKGMGKGKGEEDEAGEGGGNN